MIYHRVQSGGGGVGRSFQQVFDALPAWATGLLHRFGLSDLAMVQARLAGVLTKGSQFFASQALNIGQNAFDFLVSFFIMLYLLFFFMRDGLGLVGRLRDAVPLEAEVKRNVKTYFPRPAESFDSWFGASNKFTFPPPFPPFTPYCW